MESQKQKEHRLTYIDSKAIPLKEGIDYEVLQTDIAGNKVKVDVEYYKKIQEQRKEEAIKYIATMKDKVEMSNDEFEGLISKSGVIQFQCLGNPTLPHASAMAYWKAGSSNQGGGIHSE